jgi:predicted amidophosphoribosyltransferase
MIMKVLKRVLEACVHLLYPPLCLNCQTALKKYRPLFCSTCLDQISLAQTQERCMTCFRELYKGRCERCIHRHVVVHRQIATCEAIGPARVLLKGICEGKRECIPAAASLMAYQWLHQKLLLPELVIPLPLSYWQKHKIGFDVHLLLAKELGKIFSVPVVNVLKKRFDRSFYLARGEFAYRLEARQKPGAVLCDQRILLVSPELDDSLFRSAAKELKPFFPAQIDALAFAAECFFME